MTGEVQITDLTSRQLSNARLIFDAARPHGRDATLGALMAAGDESSWLRYRNNGKTTRADVPQRWRDLAAISMEFPGDAVAGEAWTTADSIGLFQQRLMFGYSSPDRDGVADLMDPAVSTVIFITGSSFGKTKAFLQSPTDMTLAQRVQWTQGSEYPDGVAYAPFEAVAAQIIERFGGISDAPVGAASAPALTFIEGVLMSKAVIVFFESPEGVVWEADLLTGVYYWVETGDAYGQRKEVLDFYGVPYAVEGVVAEPRKFGTKVTTQGITTDTPLRSRIDNADYPAGQYLSGMDQKSANNGVALTALAQQITAIAATLAAQDEATAAATASQP